MHFESLDTFAQPWNASEYGSGSRLEIDIQLLAYMFGGKAR
ncbi:hypothetical protein SAMN05216339_11040 [Nitrosomonas eutropha]|uniref:Uncharacterized protein n=1 Tax=Nitrosomonas eutropha TaxID=916 RepID=A0A1I7IQU3_9PROT|nr:hypothetical protein [Nitrosomonas eutropha]SFU75289.1 hypothetical protein SAMN05216339_11040 [Nitrosomonas eutropha]